MKPWSCSPARMERWRAIDRERARRSARDLETASESTEASPVAAPPAVEREPKPQKRRFGVAAEPGGSGSYRVLGGARGGD